VPGWTKRLRTHPRRLTRASKLAWSESGFTAPERRLPAGLSLVALLVVARVYHTN
jgi:hypothetical protein